MFNTSQGRDKMTEYPYIDKIVKQLKSNSFSVFCGAGASADATHKKWIDIFSETTKQFFEAEFSKDIYYLADLEKTYYNGLHFFQDIKEKLTVESSVSKHIEAIVNLNLNQIWTTNFDNIIESTIERRFGTKPTVIKNTNDLFNQPFDNAYTVYKLNGSIEDINSMVLTKSDFLEYAKKQRLVFELLKRQLVFDSFLFIGYSFEDNLVLNALREIKDVFPEKGKEHFRFSIMETNRKKDKDKCDNIKKLRKTYDKYENKYFEDKYNIHTIILDSFEDIDDYLLETYKRFCNSNIFICGSFRHISNEMRIFIEKIVDVLIERLLLSDFRVYSGNGRGLGEIVVAQMNNHTQNYAFSSIPFVNRPYIFTGDSTETKQIKNKKILKDCNTMIVICGQDDNLGVSENVKNQVSLFLDKTDTSNEPIVIPIPKTEYAANDSSVWEKVRNTQAYKQNKSDFDHLINCDEPQEIVEIIMSIILQYRSEPY